MGEVRPATEDCSTPADEDCDGAAPGCPGGALLWSKTFGTDFPQVGTAVASLGTDELSVVGGYFQGVIQLGTNLWGTDVTDTAGDHDAFVMKMSTNSGYRPWGKRLGGPGDQRVTSIALDASGDLVVTGIFEQTVDLGAGPVTSAGGYDIFVMKLNANGDHLWSQRFGGAGDDRAASVAVDTGGNVLLSGAFEGSVDFGGGALASAGGHDAFVAKLSPTGAHLWSRRFGDGGDQRAANAAISSAGEVGVTGEFEGSVDFGGGALTSAGGHDAFIVKLSATGDHVWSKRFGDGGEQRGVDIDFGWSGLVLAVGSFEGTVDFGGGALTSAGGYDSFVVALDPSGNHFWSKRIGGAGDQLVTSLASCGTQNITTCALVAGSFDGALDRDQTTTPSTGGKDAFVATLSQADGNLTFEVYGGQGDQEVTAISAASNTSFGKGHATGRFDHFFDDETQRLQLASQGTDGFVATLDYAQMYHFQPIDDDDWQSFAGVAADSAGNALLTGHLSGWTDLGGGPVGNAGGIDLHVVKLDPSGHTLWSKRYGDQADQLGQAIAVDGMDNVLVVGGFQGSMDLGGGPLVASGYNDVFVAKLDPSGNHLWSKRFGDFASQTARDVAVDAAGDVVISGNFGGTLDLGGGPLVSAGGPGYQDVFVAKLDASGNHLWSKRFGGSAAASDECYRCAAVDRAGNVALVGWFGAGIDFGAGPQSAGAYVAKLDAAGNTLWSRRFSSNAQHLRVKMDSAGDLIVLGSSTDSVDFGVFPPVSGWFLVKLDPAGNQIWRQNTTFEEITMDGDDLLLATTIGAGGNDIGLSRLDPSGGVVWNRTVGGPYYETATSIAADPGGNVLMVGFFRMLTDLGAGTVLATTDDNLFVAKLAR